MIDQIYKPVDPAWEVRVRQSFAAQTFMEFLGAHIETLGPGICHLALPYRRELLQQTGVFHAGVVSSIADTAAGYAAYTLMPAGSTVLTTEFKINLLAPAFGEKLIARARVEKSGRTLTISSCDVVAFKEGVETRVAMFVGTIICLQAKKVGQ